MLTHNTLHDICRPLHPYGTQCEKSLIPTQLPLGYIQLNKKPVKSPQQIGNKKTIRLNSFTSPETSAKLSKISETRKKFKKLPQI